MAVNKLARERGVNDPAQGSRVLKQVQTNDLCITIWYIYMCNHTSKIDSLVDSLCIFPEH